MTSEREFMTLPNNYSLKIYSPGDGWILDKIASETFRFFNNVTWIRMESGRNLQKGRPTESFFSFFVNYNLFFDDGGIPVPWFTHYDTSNPGIQMRFDEVISRVDFGLFNAPLYQRQFANRLKVSEVLIPGIDEHLTRKIKALVVGRDYKGTTEFETGRKNFNLASNLPVDLGIELVTTGGALSESELWMAYHTADVIIITSTIEGGPMALLEGLAHGKPIVMPKDVGLHEVFEPFIFSYESNNYSSFRAQVAEAILPTKKRIEAVTNCTWENFSLGLSTFFNKISLRI